MTIETSKGINKARALGGIAAWALAGALVAWSAPAAAQDAQKTQDAQQTPAGAQDGSNQSGPLTPPEQGGQHPALQPGPGDIVVTGSRIPIDGTKAPTPVTVISSTQLQQAAPRTITEGLLQLPVFAGSQSVQNQSTGTTGQNGAAHLNLRGLGTSRTLVLLDNRRVVPATAIGSVDVSLIPEALIQRVEVVTGGASAAYGSDAVAGVVNFLLDYNFRGLKATAQSGISTYGDDENYKFSIAGGTSLANDRLTVIASAEYYHSDGVPTADARPWAHEGGRGIITNPNVTAANPASPSNPTRLVVDYPLASNASLGGLITNTILAGTTFDPDGTARPYQYGTLRTSTTMAGGPDPNAFNPNLLLTLQPAQTRANGFAHIRFAATPNITLFVEGLLAENDVYYNSLPTFELSQTAFTIFADNAYLPASVRQKMAANNIQSVTVGRVSPDIAIPTLDGTSFTQRYVAGTDIKLGGDWTAKAYYQYGQNHSLFKTLDDPISRNLYRAADAVVNPTTGTIVCRSTLTNPSDGCVPLDIFGNGAPSPEALNYVVGTAIQDVTVKQHVAEATVQGSVFKLPGGMFAIAAGVGWRKERFDQTVDPNSSIIRTGAGIRGFPAGLENTLGGYERTNPQPAKGGYSVKEAFFEANAPVLANLPFAYQLTLSGAVRYTDYSTSGGVTTWKVGAVYEPIAGLRFRGTRSRDIRAPSLGELYRGSSQGTSTIIDPFNNNQTRNALTGAVGNPNLTPEIADTTVVGAVLQPRFLPGFSLSVDYYDIGIRDALSALTAQRTVDLCYGGATELCGFIQRDSSGLISRIELPFFNVDFRSTRGVDIESSYHASFGGTDVNLRAIANRLISFTTQVAGAAPIELAGDIGTNSTPKWTALFSANLANGPYSFFVQERFIGPGKLDNTLTAKDIDFNHQDAVWYTDATINIYIGEQRREQWFLTINNLFNRDPPETPSYLISGSNFGNRTLYDQIGRSFTTGMRFRF